MTHEISIFVKILFNFKEKNNLNNGQPSENYFNIAKSQEFELITLRHIKSLTSPKPAWNSQWQWSLIPSRNLKRYHLSQPNSPIFQIFSLKKERFLRKSSKPGHGNLVLITSTVQVELSKLNFNFDDIRTNFLQVLTYYGFSRLLCYNGARQNKNRTKQGKTNTYN